MIKHGQRGAAVIELQNLLNANGYALDADGIFGTGTEDALKDYQSKHGLVVDGIAGSQTINTLKGFEKSNNRQTLSESDISQAAQALNVSRAHILTVTEVETRKHGFDRAGRPILLFERHIFYRQLTKNKGANFAANIAAKYPALCNRKPGGYIGGSSEWHRLQQAREIDEQSALESASYGLFQIMGFNYAVCGFANVKDMFKAMCESEGQQLQAFVGFVGHKANAGMAKALKTNNWAGFARLYNGPAFEKNDYDSKLASAFRRYAAKEAQAA